jgi:hypothetical protein
VSAVRIPFVGAVNSYHTLLAVLRFPHQGVGSDVLLVAPSVISVALYGVVVMAVAAVQPSFGARSSKFK